MAPSGRLHPLRALLLCLPVLTACGGSGSADAPGASATGGGAGAGGGKASGGKAGAAGTSGAAGAAAKAGSAGAASTGGKAGQAGAAGGGAAGAGANAGQSGASGGGATGGTTGKSGSGGAAGAGGDAGAAGKSGGAGAGGAAGNAGSGGAPLTCKDTCKSGTCVNEVCCPKQQACGAVCCGAGDVCSFQKCVTPGVVCTEQDDCANGQYCELSLGAGGGGQGGGGGAAGKAGSGGAAGKAGSGGACTGGVDPPKGRCLPSPPLCTAGSAGAGGSAGAAGSQGGLSCVEKCEVKPQAPTFEPTLKHAWGGVTAPPYSSDVMMTPIVVQLDDDNCDGKVNQLDIPEIVFSTFTGGAYFKQGTLHAISIVGGQVVEKLNLPNVTQPGGQLAAGDLDGDGIPEIVACRNPGPSGSSCCDALASNTGVVALRADGTVLWEQTDTSKVHCGYEAPALGDTDGDGVPEVLIGVTLLDGKTGAVKRELDPATSWGARLTGLADVDGDGQLDVVEGARAWRADGTVLWDLTQGPGALSFGYHAVGDLDLDGKPEVIIVSSAGPHTMSILRYDPLSPGGAKVVRAGLDINNGTSTVTYCNRPPGSSEYGGGPPTVADFDGDGYPDIGAAGAVGYIVVSGRLAMDGSVSDAGATLWFKTTKDCSSAVTGSSVFDFNGDGKGEVIYSDEYHLWMYDGQTGTNLIPSTCNTTGTLWEYPVVADVDNDGQADIVVASNAYGITCSDDNSRQSGVRVFGSKNGSWVRTRRVWNQHTYHITNIGEDGVIPAHEQPNWKTPGLNDYRLNKQPGGEFSAPDAIVSAAGPVCAASYGLQATVTNVGQAVLPAGVDVSFYKGSPPGGALLGSTKTTLPLYPAQSETVSLAGVTDAQIKDGTAPFYVVVDGLGTPHPGWVECRPGNGTLQGVSGGCKD